jgi:hypothetical protein
MYQIGTNKVRVQSVIHLKKSEERNGTWKSRLATHIALHYNEYLLCR